MIGCMRIIWDLVGRQWLHEILLVVQGFYNFDLLTLGENQRQDQKAADRGRCPRALTLFRHTRQRTQTGRCKRRHLPQFLRSVFLGQKALLPQQTALTKEPKTQLSRPPALQLVNFCHATYSTALKHALQQKVLLIAGTGREPTILGSWAGWPTTGWFDSRGSGYIA